jgi:DNA repair protein RadC
LKEYPMSLTDSRESSMVPGAPLVEGRPEATAKRATARQPRTLQERAIVDGSEALADVELLAVLLGTGGGGAPLATVAAALVDELGVAGLARAGIGELCQRRGIGPAKALRLVAAVELGRRAVLAASLEATPRMPDRDAVVAWARPRLATLDHEELWVLLLDGRNGLRAARRVASGGIHGLHVSVRDVLRVALREAASGFILVHNHPSGEPTPSDEDGVFTRAVTQGATLVGCPLLDHVIIARERASSMLDLTSST